MGYTNSHQTVVNVLDYGDGGKIEADLEKANIIVNRQLIPGDLKAKRNYMSPGGIRLGTSEITRLGMKESEMQQIASLIKQVIIDKKDPKEITSQVIDFRKDYQKTEYCFDNKLGAYEYVKLRQLTEMEADVIAPMAVFFFSIALLTFWFKKRWKKKPEPEPEPSSDGNFVKYTREPEPPEIEPKKLKPEPETKEPEPAERDSRKFTYDKPPEREPDEQ